MNTKKHNQRKRNRKEKNLFWVVRSTLIGSTQLMLYNRKPYKLDISYDPELANYYKDKFMWFSAHGESYLNNNAINKFPITSDESIPVKLIIDNDNPDMFIQRKNDNLFIGDNTIEYVTCGDKIVELRYSSRISSKLFPEITEESGIIGVRIERYNEKEEKSI
jgi:hypothetical protein